MNAFYLFLGTFLLLLGIVDLLWTTLWVDGGAGPLSSRMTMWLWRGLRKLGGQRSRTLSLAGPLILTTTLFVWVALIWAGWVFLFAGDTGSIFDTRDDEPVTWVGRIYFVAFSMFTMGNGDFAPRDGFWQIATSFTTASGMLFVTMGVSYVLSILSAVNVKRAFASGVTGLGQRGEAFVRAGWDGESISSLNLPLSTLASQLGLLAEQHKAYSILHYYHSEEIADASAVAVAAFDEALTIIVFGLPETIRPGAALVKGARSSVESYLNTAFINPAPHAPPPPRLGYLRDAGIPTVSDEVFNQALLAHDKRRRKLLGMLEADAWQWPEPPSNQHAA